MRKDALAEPSAIRVDLQHIADLIPQGARVLDVGCGDGALLDYLVHNKHVDGRGVELSQAGVNACVSRGLSVIQGDADADLAHYPDRAFDYAVLSQTLQATREPHRVLDHLVRIAQRAIVSVPNFGHWRVRAILTCTGRMPHTATLAHQWYDTPNIHLCTITDFIELALTRALAVERSVMLSHTGRPLCGVLGRNFANLLAEQGVFVLRRQQEIKGDNRR